MSENNAINIQTEKMELKQYKALIEMMQVLEKEEPFELILNEALGIIGACLEIENIHLIQFDAENTHAEVISEWYQSTDFCFKQISERIFFTQKEQFFPQNVICIQQEKELGKYQELYQNSRIAGFLTAPIWVNGKHAFSLNLVFDKRKLQWREQEQKYIENIKSIMQCMLKKRIISNSLYRSYGVLKEILDNSRSGVLVYDKQTREILFKNKILQNQFGLSIHEFMAHAFLFQGWDESKTELHEEKNIIEFYDKKQEKWYEISTINFTWVDGREAGLITVLDVTDHRKYQQKMEFQANNDFLTGLYNRMRCENDLSIEVQKAEKNQKTGVLLYLDLDEFKKINDTWGHQYGDILLQKVAFHLNTIPDLQNKCYRVGGDEFIAIISWENYEKKEAILKAIMNIFSETWDLNGIQYQCTVSVGAAEFPEKGRDIFELIKRADMAMYHAKKNGKNQYYFVSH